MDKQLLHEKIILALETIHQSAINAARQAHVTATDKESIAENKYDTFGLEASYLAHGQAKRVAEYEVDLANYLNITVSKFDNDSKIAIGALVHLADAKGAAQCLFLSPVAGGLKLRVDDKEITLITPSSPLGAALINRSVGDEVELSLAGQTKMYDIMAIY